MKSHSIFLESMQIGAVESLELLFSSCASKCFFATTPKSPAFGLFQENIPPENIISLNLPEDCTIYNNDEAVILQSELGLHLQKRHITCLWLNSSSSERIESWALKNNISLLSTPWAIQRQWEDKLFFDNFLETNRLPKPQSWILQSEKDIDKPSGKNLIIQRPWSWGSQGTFFAKDRATLQKILIREQKYAPLLCREYIHGIPLGVTLLIGAKKVIFSALRLQAFFLKEDGTNTYLGIQWLKTNTFSEEFINTLNSVLQKLSNLLQSCGFRGVANLDFLVRENQIFIIECNPRLSGATAQLTLEKSLFHGYDFAQEFIAVLTNQELSANATKVPDSPYEGATLDLDGVLPGKIKMLTRSKPGVFQFRKGQITYVSSQLKTFISHPSNVFLYHSLSNKQLVNQQENLGILMTHFPLFEVRDTDYNLSRQGKDVLRIFQPGFCS
jgi:hypothetical protein